MLVGAVASLGDHVGLHLVEACGQTGQVLSDAQRAGEAACPSIPAGAALLPVQTLVATGLGAVLVPAFARTVEGSATYAVGVLLVELVRELIAEVTPLRLAALGYEPRVGNAVREVGGILHRTHLALIVSVHGVLQLLQTSLDLGRTALVEHFHGLLDGSLEGSLARIVGLVGQLLALGNQLVQSGHGFLGLLVLGDGILDLLQHGTGHFHVLGVGSVVQVVIDLVDLSGQTGIVGKFSLQVAQLLQIEEAVIEQDVYLFSILNLGQLDTVESHDGLTAGTGIGSPVAELHRELSGRSELKLVLGPHLRVQT